MSRYAQTKAVRDNQGKRRLQSAITPVPPFSADDVYIKITSPDRLDKLANTFYNDPTLWWVIASANGIGKGTLMVARDTVLRIPSNTNIQQFISNTNLSR
jgi:hypothetical protein